MEFEIVIIDDSQKLRNDPLIWDLNDKFGEKNIIFKEKSQEGLDYVFNNIKKNMIVILDLQFPENEKKGDKIFHEIIEKSKLIPIIFFSGNDIDSELLKDLINNHAFGYVSKMKDSQDIIPLIERAILFLEGNVDNAIEDWINDNDEDKNKQIYLTSDGKSFSLNEILFEIRNQTVVGKDFVKKFNDLTIDLLIRNKENLNG